MLDLVYESRNFIFSKFHPKEIDWTYELYGRREALSVGDDESLSSTKYKLLNLGKICLHKRETQGAIIISS